MALDGQGTYQLDTPISRTGHVASWIKKAILDGEFSPGQALVEREIAAMLGVSKTPVREALKTLLASGLVVKNDYLGVAVRSVDASTVRDLYQTRRLLEPEAVGLASGLRGRGPHAGARSALIEADSGRAAGATAAVGLANRVFHRHLYVGCGNVVLRELLDQMQDLTALVATAGWRRCPTWEQEAQEHASILDAFEQSDPVAVKALSDRHICAAMENILGSLTGPSA